MNNLYEALETCLQEMENGVGLETVLQRYPELSEELRPILLASVGAQRMAVPAPPAEVVRRNRARLLQRAAQLSEQKPRSFISLPQRWAVSFALLLIFLFGGTGIVRASSNSLPGDSLYSVKRSWENFVLFLTFDDMEREVLEIEHENERLVELRQLFATGRTARVDFAGVVARENGDGWWISNVLVIVSDQTRLPEQPIYIGAAVRVHGITRGDGIVIAERLDLLPSGAPLPEVDDDEEPEIEEPEPSATPQPESSGPGSGSGTESPEDNEDRETPAPADTPKIESFTGILISINQQVWRIDSIRVDVGDAEIKGIPVIGAPVKAEGYFGADGVFVASKIEILDTGVNDNGNVNANSNDDNGNSGSDDNTNDDDNNTNTNDKDNDDNHNDGSSGSGGGGNDNNGNSGGDD